MSKVGIVKIRQATRPSIVSQNYSAKIDISDLSGVNLGGIKEGDILVYSANTGNFEVRTAFGSSSDTALTQYAANHANSAFSYANTISGGSAIDNVARVAATSAGVYANLAYNHANAAFTFANSINEVNTTQNNSITAINAVNITQNNSITFALNTANAAFASANIINGINTTQNNSITFALNTANAAFASANIINGINITQNNSILGAFNHANAAFASANNIDGINTTQNNSILNAFNHANAAFIAANTGVDVYARNHANSAFAYANTISGGSAIDNVARTSAATADDKATSAGVYANLAYNHANAAFDAANSGSSSVFSQSAYNQANSAFNAANNKVSKSGDTMTGDLKFNGGGGILNLPTNQIAITANVDNDASGFIAQATGVSTLYANTDVIIQANTGGLPFLQWNFSKDGTVTFPDSTIQTTAFTGSAIDQVARDTANTAGSSELVQYAANHANSAFAAANTADNKGTAAGIYANGAFAMANAAQAHATAAFAAANTADNKGTAAGIYANGAFAAANAAAATNVTQNNSITAAFIWANAAYNQANTDKANLVNSGFTAQLHSNGAFALPGNLIFGPSKSRITNEGDGVLSIRANGISGNTGIYLDNASQAVLYGKTSVLIQTNQGLFDSPTKSFTFNQNGTLTFPDTTIQSTAFIGYGIDNVARNHANASFEAANNVFPQIQPSYNTANASFIRANNSLDANNGGTITGDLSISGNLSVLGNTFTISATTIVANDTVILLGAGNYTSDLLDIGISAHYNDGVNAHTGLVRDHGTKEWQLFEGYTGEIGANNDIDINNPSFRKATLNANLKSQSITLNSQDLQTYIDESYNKANAAFASANNIDGINTTQNNSITAAFVAANTADNKGTSAGIYANGAFAAANTADNKGTSAGLYANGAFAAANTAQAHATAAFNTANTDVTNINVTSNTYGNATHIPIITVSSNGRINTISTIASSGGGGGGGGLEQVFLLMGS